MEKKIDIRLASGFDPSGVQEASRSLDTVREKLSATNKRLQEINAEMSCKMHDMAELIAVDFGAAADKAARGMGRVYETLDQINARVDAPRKAAQAQEEMNRALKRYCELCEEARRREQARLNSWKSPKSQWNQGPGAGKLYRPDTPDQGAGGSVGFLSGAKSARAAIPALIAIDRMTGDLDGNLRKVANGMQGVLGLGMAFGPMGAAVGGAYAAIDLALSAYAESQQKAIDKLNEWNALQAKKNQSNMDAYFGKLARDVEGVAKAAELSAKVFEAAARKRAEFAKISEGMNEAIGQTELLKMQGEMSAAVSSADAGDRGVVAADWRVKIAEKEVELRKRAAEASAATERESLDAAEKRLDLAKRTMDRLSAAEGDAEAQYLKIRDLFKNNYADGESNPEVQRYKDLWEKAKARTRAAADAYDKSGDDLEILRKQAEVDVVRRGNSVAQAQNAAKAAEERAKAERKAIADAAAERERLDREAHQKRMADLRAEIAAAKDAASPIRSVAAAAQTEFERAFAMYRDPERARAEIAEERDRSDDLKRLHKDASRYGGKWRIDELAELMSAGDTEGVNSRLEEWRKRKSFTPEVEAMVRASAAEQTRTTAEDELRKIEGNTRDLSEKLDQLLTMKGN
ncbi:MAG: hypothetical protein IJG70_05950 [Kiritimatiellae bacterium]|nr:hypothetical protein [Kiritimatiellia bacterium]